MTIQHIITGAYFFSAVGSLYFVIRYITKRWWKTWAGILMMTFHLVMVGFGVSSTLFLLLGPDYTARLPLALLLCLGLNFVNWGWSWQLEVAQKKAKKPQDPAPVVT